MLPGIITDLMPAKRLGYVQPTAGGVPLLFNALAVEGAWFTELTLGQLVTYSLERDPLGRGARAVKVRPTSDRVADDGGEAAQSGAAVPPLDA